MEAGPTFSLHFNSMEVTPIFFPTPKTPINVELLRVEMLEYLLCFQNIVNPRNIFGYILEDRKGIWTVIVKFVGIPGNDVLSDASQHPSTIVAILAKQGTA